MKLLKKLMDLEHQAENFGFKWDHAGQVIQQIQSECDEVAEHLSNSTKESKRLLQEEIGDLLHAVFSLCVFCKLDPEKTLSLSVDKFERRFNAVKALALEDDLTSLKEKSFSELMIYWDKAKQLVG